MSDSAPAQGNEQILWTGTVSNVHYAGKWFLILILLAAVVASFLIVLPDLGLIPWAVRAAFLVLALLLFCWIQLDRRRRRYTVTNKRVSVDYGIVNRVSNEVRLSDIRSINLQKTGFTGLLGIGRVEFSSSATEDAEVIFWNTPDAERIRDLVRSLQP
jgi:membrane protein YdbS with pleckstrin-like domain